jgi:BolA protein
MTQAMTAGERMAETLQVRLTEAFHPEHLEVIDESEQHRGHAGWREGGGTHFLVVMRAARLDGLTRVERSRAVHRVLAAELAGGVHALTLELSGSRAG